jgi:hypothetical protein
LKQKDRTFSLTDDEINTVNSGQDLAINLAHRAEFNVEKEGGNRRIVDIEVSSVSSDSASGNIDIFVQHSGHSSLTQGDKTYEFEHLGYDGRPILVWHSIKNLDFGTLTSSTPSASQASLMITLLDAKTDKILLFARPGLDAAVTLSKLPKDGAKIKKLALTVNYSYYPQ